MVAALTVFGFPVPKIRERTEANSKLRINRRRNVSSWKIKIQSLLDPRSSRFRKDRIHFGLELASGGAITWQSSLTAYCQARSAGAEHTQSVILEANFLSLRMRRPLTYSAY